MTRRPVQRPKPVNTSFGILDRQAQAVPEAPSFDDRLSELLKDELRHTIEAYRYELPRLAGGVYKHVDDEAAQLIFTAAVNDAQAVVRHVDEFDGRSAALRARTLFEHLLNLCDVMDSATNTGERYLQHRWVVQDLEARRRDHLQVIQPERVQQETRRLDALARKARAPLSRAIAAYSRDYLRGWAAGPVRRRAELYGLEDAYDGYRLLSAAVHGASGSLGGVTRRIDGQAVHRTGNDLQLSSVAWWEGLVWFYELLKRLDERWPNGEAKEMAEGTATLLWAWPTVRTALRRQDEKIWPKTAPPVPGVGVVIHPRRERWYYYRPDQDVVIPIDTPDPLPTGLPERIQAARDLLARFEGGAYVDRPPLIPVSGILEGPRTGTVELPAAGFRPESTPQWHRFMQALHEVGWN